LIIGSLLSADHFFLILFLTADQSKNRYAMKVKSD